MDSVSYRALMRHQAGAVTVIAAGPAGARAGLTATAFSSLSDKPPTVLVCVQRRASAHDVIVAMGAFSVNILSSGHEHVAERFAGRDGSKGEARFETFQWSTLKTGAPILDGALASLDCQLEDEHTFATHSIFIGRVVDGRFREDGKPLLYFRNDYWDIGGR
ncbi:MAG: flavin reductase family protein [Hyphomicrobium sp.]|nr:flavin reductase family protein [Hyphomicrobium sp.]